MRISLIGPGDVRFHFHELLKISEEAMNKNIYGISETLALNNCELVILPDKGIPFEVAKKYKELGGKMVIGTVPRSDEEFGSAHLRPYMEAKVEGRKLIDEIIDTHSWYRQDMTHVLFGDCVLLLGKSPGSMGEMNFGFYIYNLLSGKNGSSRKTDDFQSQIRAGKKIPFSIIVYLPFAKDTLDYETENYVKKSGCRIAYVKDICELEKILSVLTKEYCSKKR